MALGRSPASWRPITYLRLLSEGQERVKEKRPSHNYLEEDYSGRNFRPKP